MIRHRRVFGVEPLRRHVEQAETLAGDARNDLRRHAAPRPGFAHAEQTPRARDTGDDGVGVQRFHRAQIHDFNLPAFGGQFRRRFQRFVNHGAVGHHGQVAAFAGDAGLADRQRLARQFLGLEMVIEKLVLAENHRVVNRHRLEQHAVSVLHRRRRQHDEPGIMRVNRLDGLAVKGPAALGAAERQAHRDGARDIRAPKERRRLVDDLVETDHGEIRKLHLNDRPHAFNRRAHRQTDHRVLADGRINHATRIFLGQIFRGLERAAERAHVLPVDEHARIVAQGVRLGFTDRFEIGNAHGAKW